MDANKFIYLPENFDPKEILPEHLKDFAEDAGYFVHKIYEQRVFGKKSKEDFIPLKAEYLRKIMSFRHYPSIKTLLIRHGIIESDNYYIQGKKCISYRLGSEFRNQKHKKIALTNSRLIKNIIIEKENKQKEIKTDIHCHLYDSLTCIQMDKSATTLLEHEDDIACHIAVDMINNKQWFFVPDEYGRVHTNLTNLKTIFRSKLYVNNSELQEIDISNSQPLFLALLLQSHNHHSLRCDIETKEYFNLVQEGRLYEHLAEQGNIPLSERKTFKVKLFAEVFFGKNGWVSKHTKVFAKLFPTVYRFICDCKKDDYTALSKMLQKIESDFIIGKVATRCMQERPKMFIGTIHDSFLVHKENVEFVKSLMEEEFGKLNIRPTIRVK